MGAEGRFERPGVATRWACRCPQRLPPLACLPPGSACHRLSSELLRAEHLAPGEAPPAPHPLQFVSTEDVEGEHALLTAKLERLLASGGGASDVAGGAHARVLPREQWARLERSLGLVSRPWRARRPAVVMCPQPSLKAIPRHPASPRLLAARVQAALEPPIPGLCCSQAGGDMEAYAALRQQIELLAGAVFALAAACTSGALAQLARESGAGETHVDAMRETLARSLGLAAAACARTAEALAAMPVRGPSCGEPLQGRNCRGAARERSWRRSAPVCSEPTAPCLLLLLPLQARRCAGAPSTPLPGRRRRRSLRG